MRITYLFLRNIKLNIYLFFMEFIYLFSRKLTQYLSLYVHNNYSYFADKSNDNIAFTVLVIKFGSGLQTNGNNF